MRVDRSYKTIIKRMWLTLWKGNLHHEGVFQFKIVDKVMLKLKQEKIPSYYLVVSTKDEKYLDTSKVNPYEYKRYKVGQVIPCSVIYHFSGDHIVTLETDRDLSINKVVLNSRLQLLGFIVAISLVTFSLSFFFVKLIP